MTGIALLPTRSFLPPGRPAWPARNRPAVGPPGARRRFGVPPTARPV